MTSSDSRSALPHFVGYSAYRVRRSQSTSSVGLPSGLTAGAETGLSCSHDDCPTIPRPLRRRVLRGCISKHFTPSVAFAHSTQARLPVGPLQGLLSTRQASLHAADWWVAPSLKEGSTPRFDARISPNAGGLLQRDLAPPPTGLAPVSRREPQDARRVGDWRGGRFWSGAVHALRRRRCGPETAAPFPASPHQTGHAILPHPAFRGRSSGRYRRCRAPRDGPTQPIHAERLEERPRVASFPVTPG